MSRTQFRPQSLPDTSPLDGAIRWYNTRLQEIAAALAFFPANTNERGVVDTSYDVGHVKRYGLVGNGQDATAATRFAIAALQSVPGYAQLVFDPGTYTFSAEVEGISYIDVIGWSATISPSARFHSFIQLSGKTNVRFFGLTFDLGQTVLPTYTEYDTVYNCGVYALGSSNIRFICCTFTNLYTRAVQIFNCSGYVSFHGTYCSSPQQVQGLMAEHLVVTSSGCDVVIEDLTVVNAAPSQAAYGVCAALLSGTTGSVTINNVTMDYCGRSATLLHPLQAITFYQDSVNVSCSNIVSRNTLYGAFRFQDCGKVELRDFKVYHSVLAEASEEVISVQSFGNAYGIPGAQSGCQDIHIHDGYIEELYSATRTGIQATAYDWAVPLTNVRIHDIECSGLQKPVVLAGPYKGLWVDRIGIRSATGGQISYTIDPAGVPVTAIHGVTEASSECSDLRIRDCTQAITGGATAVPITLDFTSSHSYTGTIGDIDISGHNAKAPAATVQFVVYRGIAGQGKLTARNNIMDTFTLGYDVANLLQLVIEGNQPRTVGTFYSPGAGIGTAIVRNNPGYNPVGASNVTVTASPQTYTAGVSPEVLYIKGGTVNPVTRGGITVATATDCAIPLAPNQVAVITYAVAPTIAKDIL